MVGLPGAYTQGTASLTRAKATVPTVQECQKQSLGLQCGEEHGNGPNTAGVAEGITRAAGVGERAITPGVGEHSSQAVQVVERIEGVDDNGEHDGTQA